MIRIENLKLNFDEKVIFDDVNIEIPNDKITMIVGPNGTGKTTLLKIITNEIKTNCNIQNDFKKVFYLPQKLQYPKDLTAFDYLSTALFKNTWKWFLNNEDKKKIFDILEKIELLDRAKVKIENLSAGELQKVNIGLGLLSDADIFLLDEPTSNMDLVNQIKILDMIKELTKSGIASVIIMHDLNLSSSYGDNFIGISQTHKLISAPRNQFFNEDILNEIYNIKFKVVNNEEKFYVQIFN